MREVTMTTDWFAAHGLNLGELSDDDFEHGVLVRIVGKARTGWQFFTFKNIGGAVAIEWRYPCDTRAEALKAPVERTEIPAQKPL
jgi:hypothetical protein